MATVDPNNLPAWIKKGVTYTEAMLYDLLAPEGFKGYTTVNGKKVGTLETAAAIIEAESSGNTLATNTNRDGSIDRGIWQINNVAHPDVSDACAYDPKCATKAAFKISKGGTDWSPWNSSKAVWSKKIGAPGSLAGKSGAQSAGIPTPNIPNPLDALGRIADLLTSTEFWLRLGEAIAGVLLVAMGLRSLTGQATTPMTLARMAAKAV